MQREQVLAATDRVLERLVGLVDARRRLQGHAALGLARGGKAVRMHRALQGVVGRVELGGVEANRGGRPNNAK